MASRAESIADTPLTQGINAVRLLVQRGHPVGVTQMAAALGMPKSSAHRLLQNLRQLGFGEKNEATHCYAVNPAIFAFVHDLATQFGRNLSLEKHLRIAAARLRCSVYLCMLGGGETYVICGAGDEGNTTRLGTHGPAYATSAGKVLVAHLNEATWPHYAPRAGDTPLTTCTNLDAERFYAQLREAKKQGFAWNRRETSKDHASVATIVREPFVDHPRLAVALLLRADDLLTRDLAELEHSILAVAALLERELGVRSVNKR